MNPPPSTRWQPRIIVQRWRSMLWVLTLLGLFAGLSVHFYPDLTTNTATGQILLRSDPKPGHRTSIQNPTGIAAATLRTDVVLWQTMIELNLPEEWRMEGEVCVARLEDRIFPKPDRKAGRVTLSVKGHNRSEAIRIWNKLIEVAGDEFIRLENPIQAATLKSLETEVQGLQTRVTSTHRALSMAMEAEEDSRRHRKVPSPDTLPSLPDTLPNFPGPRSSARDVQTAMAEHQQAVAALESAQGKLAVQTKIWTPLHRAGGSEHLSAPALGRVAAFANQILHHRSRRGHPPRGRPRLPPRAPLPAAIPVHVTPYDATMSTSSIRRWNPDEVITRRKRLFWLIPLLGLISGIAFSLSPLLRWKTAAGTLQIRTQSLPGETTPLFTPTDLADAIPSDEVLEKTAIALNLSEGRQGENQEPVASLRARISCRPIPGTNLVELSVKGSDRADADRTWLGLISSANRHFRARKAEITRTRLAAIAAEIEDKRIDLEAMLGAMHPPESDPKPDHYDNPLDLRGPQPGVIEDLKALN